MQALYHYTDLGRELGVGRNHDQTYIIETRSDASLAEMRAQIDGVYTIDGNEVSSTDASFTGTHVGATLEIGSIVTFTKSITMTSGADKFQGRNNQDIVHGGDGNDFFISRGGDDMIYGGKGRDWILAGSGDDILDGGAGRDHLRGDGGADTFVFYAGSGFDTILDFAAEDRVELNDFLKAGQTVESIARMAGSNLILDNGSDMIEFDDRGMEVLDWL